MKKLYSLLALLCIVCAFNVKADDLITTDPAFITEDSQNIKITFKATEGNAGMKGQTTCYAHTGVITNKGEWRYAPTWGDNSAKYKLTLVGTNKWRLTIPDIRSYYGITDPTEHVEKLCFVFRNQAATAEGKTADGGDIFVNVYQAGLALQVTNSAGTSVLNDSNCNLTLTATTSQTADITFYLGAVGATVLAQASNTTTATCKYSVPVGDFDIFVEAKTATETKVEKLEFCHHRSSQAVSYPGTLKQGANRNADGTVTFCLLAPKKTNVLLIGEWNDYTAVNSQVMDYDGDYFWTTVSGLEDGKEYAYYYLVDDKISVGDPYAHLILDPYNDKYISDKIYPHLHPYPEKIGKICLGIYNSDIDDYNWEITDFKGPAMENLMIYEVLIRDFTDATDADRSVNSLINKLDYIKSLGVNAIELMPIQEFDGNNSWGYNPNFYFAPDKAYGRIEDYKRLVDECHKRGLAVILDVVFNHAYGLAPWCMMYWGGSKPAADSPFFNVDAPHNWSVGNDWKQEVPYVQNHFTDCLKFWTATYKIDGFRFDLAKGLGNSDSYKTDYDASKYNASRITNVKRFNDAIKSVNPNAYVIYEYFVDSAEETEVSKFGAMSWNNYNMSQARQTVGGYQSNSSLAGFNDIDHKYVAFMESHDEERVQYWANQYAASGIKSNLEMTCRRHGMTAASIFLSAGAKMIWQFGEMGYDVSIDDPGRTDPKPTHWEYLNNKYRKGLVDSYSEILAIRTNHPDVFGSTGAVYANLGGWTGGRFITAYNADKSKEIVMVANPETTEKTYSYTFNNPGGTYYINSKSYNTNPSFNASAGTVTVPAGGYVIISNMKDAGVESIGVDKREAMQIFAAGNTVYVNTDKAGVIRVASIDGRSRIVKLQPGTNTIEISTPGVYIVGNQKVMIR